MLDYPPPYCAPHADTFLGIRILNGFCQESKIFKVLNFCRVLTQSFLLLLVSWRSRSRRSAWDSQHRSDYGQCPLSEVCLVKIRDSNSGWVAKLSLLRQVRVEHPNNFLFARIFSRVSGVQWGLKFRTFKYRTHLKSERFNSLVWNGSVFLS